MNKYITKIQLHSERECVLYPGLEFIIYTIEDIKLYKGYYGVIKSKSNLKKRRIVIRNDIRVINSKDNEIFIVLKNLTNEPYTIREGQIIAKLFICELTDIPGYQVSDN